jgi:hypothetical protein
MRRIVANSPGIKILFEKLFPDASEESPLESYFRELGFDLYGVRHDASLVPLMLGGLARWGGYALAARPDTIEGGLNRARFSIHPCHFRLPGSSTNNTDYLHCVGEQRSLLFFGPYWFLRAGFWRLRLHGAIHGAILFVLQESGGVVLEFEMREGQSEHVFESRRDLTAFEIVAFAATDPAEIILDRIDMIRER